MSKRPRPASNKKKAAEKEDDYTKLGKVVAQLTKPVKGRYTDLDSALLKDLKRIARSHETYAAGAVQMALSRLAAPTSDIRHLALLIIGQLFARSVAARSAVVSSLRSFMELAVGHDPAKPLPGPVPAAAALRAKALQLIEAWAESYGNAYKELRAGYRYLAESKKMQFPVIGAVQAREAQEAERRALRTQRLLYAKFVQMQRDVPEQLLDMRLALVQMREGFGIVAPDVFAEFEQPAATAEQPQQQQQQQLQHESDYDDDDAADLQWQPGSSSTVGSTTAAAANTSSSVAAAAAAAAAAADSGDSDDELDIQWENGDTTTDTANDTNAEPLEKPLDEPLDEPLTLEAVIADAGLGGAGYELEITVSTDTQQIDLHTAAAPVVDALRESYDVLQCKYKPLLTEWLSCITRLDMQLSGVGSDADEARDANRAAAMLRELVSAKGELDGVCSRFTELKLDRRESKSSSANKNRRLHISL
jgi:hypothetical protein